MTRGFESAALGLFIVDRRGAVTAANKTARLLLGSRPPLDQQPFLSVLEHCRLNRAHHCAEFTFYVRGRVYKVFGAALSGSRGFSIALADITSEKEAERAKTEFVALASHQLRTPLSVMKWMLERINGKRGKAVARQTVAESLRRIAESNEQMITLVNDLLNVARLESGKLVPEPGEVDLTVLTDHILGEFMMKAKEKKLHVAIARPRHPQKVAVDTKFLHEILTNLVSNAVKYTPAGGEIAVSIAATSGKRAAWRIRDTGVGVPQSELKKIFGKFFRGENVAGTDIEGTGLGLYIAQSMARASGGNIVCVSHEGKGSSFTLTLPRM